MVEIDLSAIATFIAAGIALYFSMVNVRQINLQNKMGVGIKGIDSNAVVEIFNGSKNDILIEVESFYLINSKSESITKDFLEELELATNIQKFYLDKISNAVSSKTVLHRQSLVSSESVKFHITDVILENIYCCYIALKVSIQNGDSDESRIYIIRYPNRGKISGSQLIPSRLKGDLNPFNEWTKVYSFSSRRDK